jgi:hypothetical protein
MPRVKEGKTQLNALISTGLYIKLVALAIKRYKKTHGAISKTLEDILSWYFNLGEEVEKENSGV